MDLDAGEMGIEAVEQTMKIGFNRLRRFRVHHNVGIAVDLNLHWLFSLCFKPHPSLPRANVPVDVPAKISFVVFSPKIACQAPKPPNCFVICDIRVAF